MGRLASFISSQQCRRACPINVVWPAGALTLAGLSTEEREKALANLSAEIGLDLCQPGLSYTLVCRHQVGTAVHPCCESRLFRHGDPDRTMRPETLRALKNWRGKNILMKQALMELMVILSSTGLALILLKYFLFVTTVSYHQSEFKTAYEIYQKNPNALCGPNATLFSQYTAAQ